MCHRTTCGTCGKATWQGCGYHIDSALEGVPIEQRCKCKEWSQAEREERRKTNTHAWALPCVVQNR